MNVKQLVVPAVTFLVMLGAGLGGARMLRGAGATAPADSTALLASGDSTGAATDSATGHVATSGDSTHRAMDHLDALASGAADSSAARAADSTAAAHGPSAFGPGGGRTSGPLVKPADALAAGKPAGAGAVPAVAGGQPPAGTSRAAPVTTTLKRMLDARTPGTIALGAPPPSPSAEEVRLSGLLGKMPPKDAARLLAQMQDREIATLLGHLADRQAAQILAALPPDRGAGVMRAGMHPTAARAPRAGTTTRGGRE